NKVTLDAQPAGIAAQSNAHQVAMVGSGDVSPRTRFGIIGPYGIASTIVGVDRDQASHGVVASEPARGSNDVGQAGSLVEHARIGQAARRRGERLEDHRSIRDSTVGGTSAQETRNQP